MATIDDLERQFEEAGGKFMQALKQVPKDDSRFKDVFEYQCKIQTLFSEWHELLKKWDDDEAILPGDAPFTNWN